MFSYDNFAGISLNVNHEASPYAFFCSAPSTSSLLNPNTLQTAQYSSLNLLLTFALEKGKIHYSRDNSAGRTRDKSNYTMAGASLCVLCV
jgi:hypothetical protein